MGTVASQITSLTIVYSTVYSGADQRKYQSSAWLAFVRGIHRGPVNPPHKWPVTWKRFAFDDVIITLRNMYKLMVIINKELIIHQPKQCRTKSCIIIVASYRQYVSNRPVNGLGASQNKHLEEPVLTRIIDLITSTVTLSSHDLQTIYVCFCFTFDIRVLLCDFRQSKLNASENISVLI